MIPSLALVTPLWEDNPRRPEVLRLFAHRLEVLRVACASSKLLPADVATRSALLTTMCSDAALLRGGLLMMVWKDSEG